MTSITDTVLHNQKEIEKIQASILKCEADLKVEIIESEKKIEELRSNIVGIQKRNDVLLALREEGFNSEEEYISVKLAESKLKEFNERKTNAKQVAIKNLETLQMYNTGAFRSTYEPKKDYIKRCEDFLGRSEALTVSVDQGTNKLWIYRDTNFEEMKRTLQETDKNIPIIFEITTKYLKYVEECILAAHQKHNQILYSKIVLDQGLITRFNTTTKVSKRWCPECIGIRYAYDYDHNAFISCKKGEFRYTPSKCIPSEKDGRPCFLKRTLQSDGCLIALPCLRRYKIKLQNDVLTSMSLDAASFRFNLEQDGVYDRYTMSDSDSD